MDSTQASALIISSKVFHSNEMIPSRYTCEGQDVNPPLEIRDIPEGTKSLALIVDDPDAPGGTWVHWVVWNIPVTKDIKENNVPGKQGTNDFNRMNYGGPCPPSGTHRYFFKVFALDTVLHIPEGVTAQRLVESMEGHILGFGELIGLYRKRQ